MVEASILAKCQRNIGYDFRDIQLLRLALTHSSFASCRADSNERLEFLGDAVLGLVICEKLYLDHESFMEGEMTKVKSAVVSRQTCASVAEELGIGEMLFLGKGIGSYDIPPSLSAAVLESMIGAIYLDGGLEPARQFILRHMASRIEAVVASRHAQNYKSILQQYAQRRWGATPAYELLDEKGPDHAKAFEIGVVIDGQRFRSAWGNNKKVAEQMAARMALQELGVVEPETVSADGPTS